MSFTFSNRLRGSGLLSILKVSPSSAINSRCRLVSLRGVSTRTLTYISPLPELCSTGTPFPRTRNVVPDCVPSCTLSLCSPPSRVGITISAPMAAWLNEIGTEQCRSLPSRSTNAGAIFHPCRHPHVDNVFFHHAAFALALAAGIRNHPPLPLAGWACPRDTEHRLLISDLTTSGACWTRAGTFRSC